MFGRHVTYAFIAWSIIVCIWCIRDLFVKGELINILWLALNLWAAWYWVTGSFEYRAWVTKRSKSKGEVQ